MPSRYSYIRHDSQNKLVYTKWLRAVSSQEYRLSITQFYNTLVHYAPLYWLVDLTRLNTPDMPDQKWTAQLIGPGICTTSLKKIAVVLPDDLFLEVVAEKIGEEVLRLCDDKVEIAYFKDYTQALSWLNVSIDTNDLFKEETLEETN